MIMFSEYCWQQLGNNSELAHRNLTLRDTPNGMIAEWLDSNSIKYPSITTMKWKGTDKKLALKWLSRYVLPKSDQARTCRRILDLYRNSGLMPKTRCKDHGQMLKEWFGPKWRENKRALQFLINISWKYIRNFAKCPHCKSHECWEEQIEGIKCLNCGATWVDMGNEGYWNV
jgi:hypothetical protein